MGRDRQIRLNAFMRPTTIHTGSWRWPGAYADANFNFDHIKKFAQRLEEAKFDSFFMADHLAVLNMPIEALRRSTTQCRPFTTFGIVFDGDEPSHARRFFLIISAADAGLELSRLPILSLWKKTKSTRKPPSPRYDVVTTC